MEKNLLKKYESSFSEKLILFLNVYEFGNLINSINSARYTSLDNFAENFVNFQENKNHDSRDFLFEIKLDPEEGMQLRKYLLKQKKFFLKQISKKEYFDYSHLYQLYLEFIPFCLNEVEKSILLDGYMRIVTELKGHNVSQVRRSALERRLNINK